MRLLALLQYTLAAVATIVLAPPAVVFSFLGFPRAAYLSVRAFAWLVRAATGVRCRVEGSENIPESSPYVVIANHCSHLDAPSIVRAFFHPLYMVFKKELAKIPLFGLALLRIGFIAVERSGSGEARREMTQAVDAIRKGRRVLVFAEGTRSRDGALQPFKKGGFHLAIDAQVPILPVAVNGSHRLLPKGGTAVRPGVVTVVIGRPIDTSGMTAEDLEELIERTHRAVLEARRLDPDYPTRPPGCGL